MNLRHLPLVLTLTCLTFVMFCASVSKGEAVVLDDFESIDTWRVITADGVHASISQVDGSNGKAMKVDFDFGGGAGYFVVQRPLQMPLPLNYRFGFDVRGECLDNNLEFKLLSDGTGDVWWVNQHNFSFPNNWESIRYKARNFRFAWGPSGGKRMEKLGALEFALSAGHGGKGSVVFDTLTFEELPPVKPISIKPTVRFSDSKIQPIKLPLSGRGVVNWQAKQDSKTEWMEIDFGQVREFGGLVLHWDEKNYASDYEVLLSTGGKEWEHGAKIAEGNGGRDYILIQDGEADKVRINISATANRKPATLNSIEIKDIGFSRSTNEAFKTIAQESPHGWYPRYFLAKQTPWTVVGVAGDAKEGLFGATGALEVDKCSFSIEPFILLNNQLITWADVNITHRLEKDYIPIPSVKWQGKGFNLDITALADGKPGDSSLVGRYVLTNTSEKAINGSIVLAIRPFQSLPPWQDLNVTGGVANIDTISFTGDTAVVNNSKVVIPWTKPTKVGTSTFAQGGIIENLAKNFIPSFETATDPAGLASGAFSYVFNLKPGETRMVAVSIPFHGKYPTGVELPVSEKELEGKLTARFTGKIAEWESSLNRVKLTLPPAGNELLNTFRTTQGYILINGDGPSIQPGSRSYERSWIRDGSLTSTALLGTGHTEKVRAFLDWYSGFLFDNGKVPCAVDYRGADPVDEHDSTGQYIYALLKYYRFTGDKDFLASHLDKIKAGVEYIDELRHRRMTDEYKNGPAEKRACYGLVPESISHEGYSAKPMHSYWDSFFVIKGLKDATTIAEILNEKKLAQKFARIRDEYHRDLYNSMRLAMKIKGIDYIPGCVELGDFDATSTTVGLFPCGEQGNIPEPQLSNTFKRYYEFFQNRRDGKKAWEAYTPYELRTVGTFVHMGEAEKAHELLDFFFADKRPRAWNQWAEVVWRVPDNPKFIGDMPHTWVGSDFVNAVRSMFVYELESESALVLAFGVPAGWIESQEGISVEGFPTEYGNVSYVLKGDAKQTTLDFSSEFRLQPKKLILKTSGKRPIARVTLDGKEINTYSDGEVSFLAGKGRLIIEYK